jgi:hypothetical protein
MGEVEGTEVMQSVRTRSISEAALVLFMRTAWEMVNCSDALRYASYLTLGFRIGTRLTWVVG